MLVCVVTRCSLLSWQHSCPVTTYSRVKFWTQSNQQHVKFKETYWLKDKNKQFSSMWETPPMSDWQVWKSRFINVSIVLYNCFVKITAFFIWLFFDSRLWLLVYVTYIHKLLIARFSEKRKYKVSLHFLSHIRSKPFITLSEREFFFMYNSTY